MAFDSHHLLRPDWGERWLTEAEVESRFRPAITDQHAEWGSILWKFEKIINEPSNNFERTLKALFTRNEILLLLPSMHPDLRRLQDLNAARYRDLRASRFFQTSPTVGTRLTMMYFGLPVDSEQFLPFPEGDTPPGRNASQILQLVRGGFDDGLEGQLMLDDLNRKWMEISRCRSTS